MSESLRIKYSLIMQIVDAIEEYKVKATARGLNTTMIDDIDNIIAEIFQKELENKREG